MRKKLMMWVVKNILGIPMGHALPKWFMNTFVLIVFPIKWFRWSNPWFRYNPASDTLTIDGVDISLTVLEHMVKGPSTHWFRIVKKEGNMLIIEGMIVEEKENKAKH